MNQHPRYLIKQPSVPRSLEILVKVAILMLGILYCAGFAYYATSDDPFLDRQIEGR